MSVPLVRVVAAIARQEGATCMTALDQARTARSPATWSGELVRQRLVEAFAIERRMPPDRFATMAASWPATPLHTFVEMLHWDDARQRVWDD